MEKRKWLWKRKSSDKSPGESESSGSVSSPSERYSDDPEVFKSSPNHNTQSPEVTSKSMASVEEISDASSKKEAHDSVKRLTEKLSAALVNVSAKEDLVKQHAKVAEEAVAGWEKAEDEVIVLKQQLESAIQQNSVLEDRVSHLDGALKELVRQLRQARDEQGQKIHEAVMTKTREWETTKLQLESQLLELQSNTDAGKPGSCAIVDPDLYHKLEYLEKENSALKLELQSQSEELEIRTIERDLSTQAAETASKQHLESIKKVAKLEAECRRLRSMPCKSSSVNDHKSNTASSIYVESLIDSQSENGERLSLGEIDTRKMCSSDPSKCEHSCSDSWASALIAELDQFKNEKTAKRNIQASSVQMDLMDDFLEMERLAALPETKNGSHGLTPVVSHQSIDEDSSLRTELEAMTGRIAELEEKLGKAEAQKAELETTLITSQEAIEASQLQLREAEAHKAELETTLITSQEAIEASQLQLREAEAQKAELETALITSQEAIEASQLQLREAELKLEELQMELNIAKETKQAVETRLIDMEAEARTMHAKVDSIEVEVQKERALSKEIAVQCRELEEELSMKRQEIELQKTASSNSELKIKQEDLAVAAGKLAECQKTIASLGNQLKSLATLEDFLIDTANIPELSAGASVIPKADEELWKLHCNETFSPKRDSDSSRVADEISGSSINKIEGNSPPSSSSETSAAALSNHVSYEKNRNGFAKFFSRTKSGIRLEI
ncbi:filament-like plant protein [Juglans microcarpa x Juglans regia]|uniref:filament-like plant protein n=1 Tax=Juglans microcarpa x Juglans regia TaxID=2249226 RepID=UPI001B7E1780|nr:filament-like plant protein [Juglans microcarpa x Juglans regia]XP_041010103.1 filament-like plant protein [Juglans microcarpa x Juglans regia]XP_041010104.1 filament-like plant protein [Juglans microcarpa x Juglans regia]XP_041010105.1 filament-like plant protein [Juglans microcarpa x Juglans regia]